ncbi:hypothetical protein AX766_07070 [Flavobacterium covae]|nr:hypothetical protein AX766_07070 [Flavobacterium covae]
MLDPRVGRWFARDAKEREFPDVSPYQYSLNNPVIVTDPDGKKPKVTVTNEVVGYGYQRVHDPEGKLGYDAYIKVPLYKVIVEDTKNKSYHREYATVRDAYEIQDISKDKNNKTVVKLINRSFEPINKNMKFELARTPNFPTGNDAPGYQILYKDGGTLPNDPSYSGEKTKSGVFIHVGGVYENTNDGGTRPVYSEGCMDLCDPDQFLIPIEDLIKGKYPKLLGNEYVKDFDKEYQKIAKKDLDKKTGKPKNADLSIAKRNKPKTPSTIKKYVPKKA